MEPRALTREVAGAGEPLVLVPGGLTGWLSWLPLVPALSSGSRVVRVQPIGNELGSRGEPGDPTYTAVTERESLRLTLEELGLAAVDLVGWSGGGRALLELAMEYPGLVRSLALVEPAAYWVLEQLAEPDPDVDELNEFVHGLTGTAVDEDDLARFLRLAGFVGPAEDPRAHPGWQRWLPHRAALSWQGEPVDRNGRAVAELEGVVAPTLLFRGTVTAPWLRRVVDVLAGRLPHVTVVELEGDHACHLQSPDAFVSALGRHLSEVRGSAVA